jgi:uncharacterized protein YsxB (DUF464 family)
MHKIKIMKVQTTKIGGGADYAKVADRIKLFREQNPNGLIETTPTITGTMIMFKARILKDKSDVNSGEASGHAMLENKGQKAFEKVESIAVGRALALLGYMASGEIASSEEMEEFNDYKEQQRLEKIQELIEQAEQIKSKEELRKFSGENKGYGKEFEAKIVELSKTLK